MEHSHWWLEESYIDPDDYWPDWVVNTISVFVCGFFTVLLVVNLIRFWMVVWELWR